VRDFMAVAPPICDSGFGRPSAWFYRLFRWLVWQSNGFLRRQFLYNKDESGLGGKVFLFKVHAPAAGLPRPEPLATWALDDEFSHHRCGKKNFYGTARAWMRNSATLVRS